MESFVTDVRYGVRMLLKTPGLSLVAVLTMGLGVGLTTHTFSVVYGTMLRGLEFDSGTRLIAVGEEVLAEDSRSNTIPLLDVVDFREEQTSFRGLGAYLGGNTVNLADEGAPPERYLGARVSASLFEQVDGVPVLGRVFTPDEDVGAPVVVIGYDVWQNRYGGDPAIVGTDVRANSERATIIGVMPEGFHFPFEEEVWLPLGIDPVEAVRGDQRVQVVGRLLPGVSTEQATAQLEGIARRIAEDHPETNEGVGVWAEAFEDVMMPAAIVAVMWVMLIAVFGVLLIACFNVANLLLARAAVRSKEVAIRSALGADRARLIRQLMLEAVLLATVGGALGVGLAWLGIEAFNAAILDIQKPYWIDIRLDGPALAFTLAVTAFASVAAGTLPAVRASGGQAQEILQDESRGSSSFRMGRFSEALVVGEIAMSCALLVAAGMMIMSVVNVNQRDMGFDGEQVLTARVGLPEADYPDDESRRRFFDRLLEELRNDPGTVTAGLTQNLPALGAGGARIALEGVAYAEVRDRPIANVTSMTPGYLDALDATLLEGRDFGEQDRDGAVPVAIVNESFVRRHFDDRSPLDLRFQMGEDGPWLTVVGVVEDLYVGGGGPGGIGSDQRPNDQFFIPLAQAANVRFVSLAVNTRGAPGAFAGTARSIVQGIDAGLPLYWVRTMDESVQSATWIFDIFGSLFTIFGASALFLAAVGLYGVMAFSVSRRTQEMGIRMALGAGKRTVLGLVLGKGMKQLMIGTAVGLALGAVLVRPMAAVFYDVEPSDPLVYAVIALTLGLAGLLACLVPARRATRVELVTALRPE